MIVMFLAAEMMAAGHFCQSDRSGSRYHNDFGGQMFVVFIITVCCLRSGHCARLDPDALSGLWIAGHHCLASVALRPTSHPMSMKRFRNRPETTRPPGPG